MKKTQKGITLVALVITIIVLLILAVVAIGAVRDSGIIGHAQNSADRYNTGKAEEESMLGQYEEAISQYETDGKFETNGSGNGEFDAEEEEISVAEYYWYEENAEGGITILGPKKIKYINEEKMVAKGREIIDSEYGEGKFEEFINEEITDEELASEIEYKLNDLEQRIHYSSEYDEIYDVREVSKEEVGTREFYDLSEHIGVDGLKLYSTKKLPEYIDGKPVTQIGEYAFAYINILNGEFIPNTVKIIDENAFDDATFISDVVIPDSVEEIRKEAFRSSNVIGDIEIIINDTKGNLKLIGESAFEKSDFSGNLNLRSVINIGNYAFSDADDIIVTRK